MLAVGVDRLVVYVGYVLLAGTVTFWTLVWPEGRRDNKLVIMAVAGIVLLLVGSLVGPALAVFGGNQTWDGILTSISGVALLLRLIALAAAAFFLDTRLPITGWWRLVPAGILSALAASLVMASNAVGGPWQTAKIVATTGHIVATAAWLGGLLALAAVLIPREHLTELDRLIPRFSVVAASSVAVLLVTGTVHALAIAGGVVPLVESRYGLVFGIKVAVFAIMLLLGNHGRRYAATVAARAKTAGTQQMQHSHSVHALAVVMGAELAIAFSILATTAILVMVAPG